MISSRSCLLDVGEFKFVNERAVIWLVSFHPDSPVYRYWTRSAQPHHVTRAEMAKHQTVFTQPDSDVENISPTVKKDVTVVMAKSRKP
jgi:hypothetical protein